MHHGSLSLNPVRANQADFLAHSPLPAASRNLSLGLLPSLPFCHCLIPLHSLAITSDCTWSCSLAFPHIPLRHRDNPSH